MSRILKISISVLLIFLFVCTFSFVKATEDVIDESEAYEEDTNVISENASDISPLSVFNPSTGTSVSNINSYEQANLSLNNILSIILISIGILLILFSIAILIRLGK